MSVNWFALGMTAALVGVVLLCAITIVRALETGRRGGDDTPE